LGPRGKPRFRFVGSAVGDGCRSFLFVGRGVGAGVSPPPSSSSVLRSFLFVGRGVGYGEYVGSAVGSVGLRSLRFVGWGAAT
jgi:hypothetical protein